MGAAANPANVGLNDSANEWTDVSNFPQPEFSGIWVSAVRDTRFRTNVAGTADDPLGLDTPARLVST